MDFNFSEQQKMLQTMARDFLARECPKTRIRELEQSDLGYDPQTWRKMADLGWLGLVFPEEYAGTNSEFMDLVALAEEMGRNILPGPFFSTVVLCALPILEFGTSSQKAEFLSPIANGNGVWAFAMAESSARYKASEIRTSAKPAGEGFIINGDKVFVTDAHVADYFLLAARTSEVESPENGITLFAVDASSPGIQTEIMPTFAGDRQCHVTFKDVKVPNERILGTIDKGWEIIDFIFQRATILKSAEMAGACSAVLEMANTYAKDRIQFDKPIGFFQAIQHKLADMLIDVEGLLYLVYEAAWLMSIGAPCNLQISITKAKANEVYEHTCTDGIKIHGAIGFTMDHDIGLYFRRVKAAEYFLGDTDSHLEKVADAIGLK
jgi:alkylation response protein AidB-like acyl-CoA dehydrogenase